ncbi:hypothetical protein [Neptunicella sp.]|uniref:hypothetical protein n=1 Tax=Neptunicella sp. TaxID=2125986 RepID=UPI003F68DD51
MTTTVTVAAHCDKTTTHVEVQVLDGEKDGQNIYVEDGESVDFTVYGSRELRIAEIPK